MAKNMIDILLVPVAGGADLKVVGGDFLVGESKAEHNKMLIYCDKGEFMANPTVCVGGVNYFDGEDPQRLLNAISEELTRDGMNVRSVALGVDGEILTDGFYK